jgi:molybdate transport system substrate-binding protein
MKIFRGLVLFFICLFFHSCYYGVTKQETVTIATSANMQYAMEALAERYTENTGIPCELIIGSSGKLTAQIREGAPYDLFVAANMKYPLEVARQGLAASPPKMYANGSLVLWTIKEGVTPTLDLLTRESVSHIAIANPKTAPYGKAAMEVLQHLNLFDSLTPKLVFGESISQTNQFVISGSAEIGFTALSVVLSPQMKGRGAWIAISSELHAPVEQGVVLLKKKAGPGEGARKFYEYLAGHEAAGILKNYGYSVSE